MEISICAHMQTRPTQVSKPPPQAPFHRCFLPTGVHKKTSVCQNRKFSAHRCVHLLISTARRQTIDNCVTDMSAPASRGGCPGAGLAASARGALKQKLQILARMFFAARWVVVHRDMFRRYITDGNTRNVPTEYATPSSLCLPYCRVR